MASKLLSIIIESRLRRQLSRIRRAAAQPVPVETLATWRQLAFMGLVIGITLLGCWLIHLGYPHLHYRLLKWGYGEDTLVSTHPTPAFAIASWVVVGPYLVGLLLARSVRWPEAQLNYWRINAILYFLREIGRREVPSRDHLEAQAAWFDLEAGGRAIRQHVRRQGLWVLVLAALPLQTCALMSATLVDDSGLHGWRSFDVSPDLDPWRSITGLTLSETEEGGLPAVIEYGRFSTTTFWRERDRIAPPQEALRLIRHFERRWIPVKVEVDTDIKADVGRNQLHPVLRSALSVERSQQASPERVRKPDTYDPGAP